MSEAINCPACGGSGCQPESSQACLACGGATVIIDTGPPRTEFVTEVFRVTGSATERVIVTWPRGTEITVYRPPEES